MSGTRLNSLRIKECSSSKSASCRTGSTRNEKTYPYFNKPSSMNVRHTHMAVELEKELMMSIIASPRIGQSTPRFSVEPAKTLLLPCSSVTCPSHRTLMLVEPEMKSENSSRPLLCSRLRALP
jgi:hypothetical protein